MISGGVWGQIIQPEKSMVEEDVMDPAWDETMV